MVTLDMFRNAKDARPYLAGEAIFRAGDRGDNMYVVVEGEVSVSANGRELELLGPGGVFGEIALIDNGPRSADAIAVTDCRVVPIDENWFKFLVQQTPYFSLQIMRVMADRLRRSMPAP
ncbi:MAG TPA: cyclic nucleotide-binding domain-containing protein [Burkholderiales bacterium]|nr:cyclic nucleotide-binding domain-containing protein [Burkholderiales bacterium]